METGTRAQLLDRIVAAIEARVVTHPTRVAVDGPPAAGKSILADEVAAALRARGRMVVRASIEGFLFPRSRRYRRGEDSPEACYHDNFDYETLYRVLVGPLGPGGDRRFQSAIYDNRADAPLATPTSTAAGDAVLLFDGVFLLRPGLVDWWDLSIFVTAAFEETVNRACVRDLSTFGSVAAVERRFRTRYIPAQEIYVAEARPKDRADIVVGNDAPSRPVWDVRANRVA